MSLSKLTENLNNISSLPNRPTLQPEELKKVFDESENIIKEYLNTVLTEEIDTIINEIKSSITKNTTELSNSIKEVTNSVDTNTNNIENKQNKITSGTDAPSGGSDGDIYIQLF